MHRNERTSAFRRSVRSGRVGLDAIGFLQIPDAATGSLAIMGITRYRSRALPLSLTAIFVVGIGGSCATGLRPSASCSAFAAETVYDAGTVLDTEMAAKCLAAGARFITSPGLIRDVLEYTIKSEAVAIPGALTPSEVIAAWKAGPTSSKSSPAPRSAVTNTFARSRFRCRKFH